MVYDEELYDAENVLKDSFIIKKTVLQEKRNEKNINTRPREINRRRDDVILDGVDNKENVFNFNDLNNKAKEMNTFKEIFKEKENPFQNSHRNKQDWKNKEFSGYYKARNEGKNFKSGAEVNEQNYNLIQIQNELDKLKETHKRMFSVKGKIYLAVEKEVESFKEELKKTSRREVEEKEKEIDRLYETIEELRRECEVVKVERDKFRKVYLKLKEKFKSIA